MRDLMTPNKKRNRLRRMAALALLAAVALAGCRPLVADDAQVVSVYATFYPIYALTDAVLGDVPDTELHCLVQPQDGCLRNYRLSDWDAALLASGANAVICGGRGLESFESTLFGWGDDGPAVSAVLYNLELYQGEGAADDGAENHLSGANPHLYMSMDGAKQIVESICASMVAVDPRYSEAYIANAAEACEALEDLLSSEREALSDRRGQRVALMNETLVYVARDYGLTVAAQIDRESGVAPVDGELRDCIEKLTEARASVIMIERQAPRAFVEALEAAGFAVARIDILSTHREGEGFERYLDIQTDNARAIQDAFIRADAMEGNH